VGTYCYVAVRRGRLGGARRFGANRGRTGAGILWRLPHSLFRLQCNSPEQVIIIIIIIIIIIPMTMFIVLSS